MPRSPSLHVGSIALGPILRSISRHKGAFALMVFELASGFTIVSVLIIASSWYFGLGHRATGTDDGALIAITVLAPAAPGSATDAQTAAVARGAAERAALGACAEVESASAASGSAADERWTLPTALSWQDAPAGTASPDAFGMVVDADPSIVTVLRLRFLEGEPPADPARAAAAPSIIITRRLRDRLFPPGQAAVGQTVAGERLAPVRIGGVVENVAMTTPLLPHHDSVAFRFGAPPDERETRYLVRARPGQRPAALAALAARLGPSRPDRLVSIAAFEARAARSHELANGLVLFLALVGTVVGIIALVGAMSVSSFLVAQRRRQIGIRRALGATRSDIVLHFLVENTVVTTVGILLGLAITLPLSSVMKQAFLDLQLRWHLLLLSALLLWLDATIAAMLPALRAAEVAPSVASRGA